MHGLSPSERFEENVVAKVPLAIAAVLMVLAAAIKNRKTHHLLKMIAQPLWLVNFALVIAFSVYVLEFAPPSPTTTSMRSAVGNGILSLVIALMSEAGLTVGPFWAVFLVSYFLGMRGE